VIAAAFALAATVPAQTPAPASPAPADCGCESQPLPEVLAEVNGVRITRGDLSEQTRARVAELQRQVVAARARELDLQIDSMLLEAEAKRRGVSPTKVVEDEVVAKAAEPTEAEAQAFYAQNSARIQGEFKDAKDEIVAYLRYQRRQQHASKLAERLRAAAATFVIEPYLRFAGEPGEQWTMFLLDPAGNALEFKAFRDLTQLFAT
jgi:hypothetical protein